jgi:hypothetical protein
LLLEPGGDEFSLEQLAAGHPVASTDGRLRTWILGAADHLESRIGTAARGRSVPYRRGEFKSPFDTIDNPRDDQTSGSAVLGTAADVIGGE